MVYTMKDWNREKWSIRLLVLLALALSVYAAFLK